MGDKAQSLPARLKIGAGRIGAFLGNLLKTEADFGNGQ